MYELTLSPAEIEEITGYKRYTQQQRQLRAHGIPFTTGRKNEPIVLRKHFLQEVAPLPKIDEYASEEPNFAALDTPRSNKHRRNSE